MCCSDQLKWQLVPVIQLFTCLVTLGPEAVIDCSTIGAGLAVKRNRLMIARCDIDSSCWMLAVAMAATYAIDSGRCMPLTSFRNTG